MNAKRKETALKTFAPLYYAGNDKEDIINAILVNDKAYTHEEAEDIYTALDADYHKHTQAYEYWKVRPLYDGANITGWKKLEECIATVNVEPRYVEALNEQSHNSGFRYFIVK